ncbi:12S seed storage globulin 1 [Gossypium australe]|uniref:12S seed storage globulin 1 n=1 Tax=Gossypium australe TaxID=47621 RepID=A0A5B6W1V8_9ROSI|nr:12S seed storage globulin 1 [Gossypium australe]
MFFLQLGIKPYTLSIKWFLLKNDICVLVLTGWLQSVYGIHTFRVESIAHGKAAPVDELQVQGVANPALLRRVIVREAAKAIQEVGRGWKLSTVTGEVETASRMTSSFTEGQPILRSPAKSWKMTASPRHSSVERRAMVPGELFMQKLEEVNKSVKKIELLIEKSQASSEPEGS